MKLNLNIFELIDLAQKAPSQNIQGIKVAVVWVKPYDSDKYIKVAVYGLAGRSGDMAVFATTNPKEVVATARKRWKIILPSNATMEWFEDPVRVKL